MSVPWYKNAVIYSLDVRTYQDSDGDGVGDFDGLHDRLEYLSSLGVTALWLLPFFPSPLRDAGYDVVDHFTVDEQLGGMPGFVRFATRAKNLGIRIIVDLPINHTSVDHPWFQEARNSRDSPFRDYYVWADEPPPTSPEQIVWHGADSTPWTYDEEAGQHYFHRFYEHEPDLNHASPAVRSEVLRIIQFWLELGASGVRIDAAPYIAGKSAGDPAEPTPHPFLREMHDRAVEVRTDAMLMAEADVNPAELASYFGEGNEVQVLFNFVLNNYTFLALAREEADPLVHALGFLPRRPVGGQWANWIRNHDELDLERLTVPEREAVMQAFAPDEEMRIYGRGIRRRLAPMLGGDQRRMEMAYSLLFSLPGSPIVRYGEEIGMGDDLSLPERNSVRTPMQWSPLEGGGFSAAETDQLVTPVLHDHQFGASKVNVADQQRRRGSFLSKVQMLIAVRRQHPEIGEVEPQFLSVEEPSVLAISYEAGDEVTVIVHNLGAERCRVRLDALSAHRYCFDFFGDDGYDPPDEDSTLEVGPYGYRWLTLSAAELPPLEPAARAALRGSTG